MMYSPTETQADSLINDLASNYINISLFKRKHRHSTKYLKKRDKEE